MSHLSLRGLTKAYGKMVIVDHINLTLNEGEFVSLLGPSGCGKTTTLRMIAGFIEPTDGTVEMGGKVISMPGSVMPPERRQMSMIFQSYAIWPNMTVAENVGFGLKLRKLPAAEVQRRIAEILEVVQMGHLAGRYPAELSGGQQQRVALARAIVVKPAVLLLDEPLSNLDANLREEMRFEIRRLHNEFRITTVYVTHDQAEAMATSDRIAVMHAGRIEQVDAPHLLYTRPKTRFVAGFIGRTNLLEAKLEAGEIGFDGVAFQAGQVDASLNGANRSVLLSVRPQSIGLHRTQPAGATGRPVVPGTVTQRVFLGETWDYLIQPRGSGIKLRVTAPPLQVHEVGEAVWLEFDPRQMALVE
ncbi:ABC transporter ATP-binding protein [Siccirubricoccus sp. KC 17139]|uniref:ABC transporter ATP-binding protein n=1 Tax=Siccirubricoccus soli TaxID=2899147 RepID=A0ABT1CYV7_9PROT|nr:ABC transporter ATP-binding protein [Siccirubricoccus soli]MCO6414853.1 ABC transporter ATP-binding protein [Siccirubricoccus soli]MCP2680983.1 ABC transporter ATP-binding protein [Siccirubricoccus soli]